jgi:hypothetical protein
MGWHPHDPHRPVPPPDLRHVTPRVWIRGDKVWIGVPPEDVPQEDAPPLDTITSSANGRK